MKKEKIIYLANPYSPHIYRWIELIDKKYEVLILHVEHEAYLPKTYTNEVRLLSPLVCKLKILRYLIGGLKLRFLSRYKEIDFLHAHNTSGYGLMALLSGKKFVVTTYGSEIYRVETSSYLYRAVIGKILSKAKKVTCSTDYMHEFLKTKLEISENKIHSFSLGITYSYKQKKPKQIPEINDFVGDSELVIFSNRRLQQLYCIDYIVKEFAKVVDCQSDAKLIILKGDYDVDYERYIKDLVLDLDLTRNVHVIDKYLEAEEIKWINEISLFSISIPKSDQLSSSILESIYSGTRPILRNLPAYKKLFDGGLASELCDTGVGALSDIVLKLYRNLLDGSISDTTFDEYFCDETITRNVESLYHN